MSSFVLVSQNCFNQSWFFILSYELQNFFLLLWRRILFGQQWICRYHLALCHFHNINSANPWVTVVFLYSRVFFYISSFSIFKFLLQKSFSLLIMFIPRFLFWSFYTLIFLISFLIFSQWAYKTATDFFYKSWIILLHWKCTSILRAFCEVIKVSTIKSYHLQVGLFWFLTFLCSSFLSNSWCNN